MIHVFRGFLPSAIKLDRNRIRFIHFILTSPKLNPNAFCGMEPKTAKPTPNLSNCHAKLKLVIGSSFRVNHPYLYAPPQSFSIPLYYYFARISNYLSIKVSVGVTTSISLAQLPLNFNWCHLCELVN